MNTINKKQIVIIKTLLRKVGADSADMATAYSNGRTDHVSELYLPEASELIKFLLNHSGNQITPAEKMRRKILSMAHHMGWQKPGISAVVDIARINAWCQKFGYLHKPLNNYKTNELPQLISQFERVYKSFLKGL